MVRVHVCAMPGCSCIHLKAIGLEGVCDDFITTEGAHLMDWLAGKFQVQRPATNNTHTHTHTHTHTAARTTRLLLDRCSVLYSSRMLH